MTGNPINDGYGGVITDGYPLDDGGLGETTFSAPILDGYPTTATGPVPFVSALARILASHFARVPFAGRRAKPSAKGRSGSAVAAPYSNRNQLFARNAHFRIPPYAGRGARRPDLRYYGGGVNNPPRASQVVTESLVFPAAQVRASQITPEILIRALSPLRASQTVVEALYQQENPTYVRASQVVVEALVPFTELPMIPVFPTLPGLSIEVVKRPKFSTGRGVASSGREIGVGYWSLPQWEWDLTFNALNDDNAYYAQSVAGSDIKTLIGFFLTVFGSLSPFYYTDPDDNAVTAQPLQSLSNGTDTGDGVNTQFLFQRTYGIGGFTGTEPVGAVNAAEALNIYLNGVLQTTGFTINSNTPCGNYVQFSTPPAAGVVVTADFSYYYFCRFKDDTADFSRFLDKMWEQRGLTIFSLKN